MIHISKFLGHLSLEGLHQEKTTKNNEVEVMNCRLLSQPENYHTNYHQPTPHQTPQQRPCCHAM